MKQMPSMKIKEVDTTRPFSCKDSAMLTITSSSAAASAEQLLAKIAADKRALESMVADYFSASGHDTFPAANDVALTAQDLIASLDDLKAEVSHAIEMYDTRSPASIY
jgi:hypothetical protein